MTLENNGLDISATEGESAVNNFDSTWNEARDACQSDMGATDDERDPRALY